MLNIPQRKNGFTLIELLVVSAVIAILVGLLLPAVQQAREAARRVKCQNNLKQIGIAFQNYHDIHGQLPPGFIAQQEFSGASQLNQFGWGTMLLPSLDQAALYNQFDFNELSWTNSGAVDNLERAQQVLTVFRCPSDTGPSRIDRGCPGDSGLQMAVSNYAGVEGIRKMVLPCWGPTAIRSNSVQFFHYPPGACRPPDGPLFLNSNTGFRDIRDGTSQTILAGEVSSDLNRKQCRSTFIVSMLPLTPYNGVSWAGVYQSYHSEHVVLSTDKEFNDLDRDGYSDGFSSRHSGGAFFLFCDGHVRFLSENIDNNPQPPYGTFQGLSTIKGNEILGEF